MSYCRWSSDSFRCDLYCYEDASGGWTTHVAGRKRVLPDDVRDADAGLLKIDSTEWVRRHNAFMAALDQYPLVDIDLPHAGETFNDATLEEFRERIVWLKGLGYRVPDCVLEAIDQEIADLPLRPGEVPATPPKPSEVA